MTNFFNNLGSAIGDVGYQGYLESVSQIRKTLIGGSQDGPKMDAATQKYFLKVKALGLLYIGAENVQAFAADTKTKNYYNKKAAKKASDAGVAAQKVSGASQGPNTTQYYEDLAKYRDQIQQQSGISPGETEPTTNSDFVSQTTPRTPVPDHIQELYSANEETGEKNKTYFRDNNSNNWSNSSMPAGHDAFPAPGEDISGHDGIGEVAASQATYDVPGTPGKPAQKLHKSWAKVPKGTIDQTATPLSPLTDRLAEMIENQRQVTPGSYRFFIEKLHGKSYDGNFFKKGPIKAGLTPKELPNRMVFPAYISKFNDSYDTSWDSYNFIGRGEKVYIYKDTDRSLTLEFQMMSDYSSELLMAAVDTASKVKGKQSNSVGNANKNKATTNGANSKAVDMLKNNTADPKANVAQNEEDILKGVQEILPDWGDGTTPNPIPNNGNLSGFVPGQISGTPEMLYERMTFLAQCNYAWYRKDGKMKEQPFIRVRIGDFFDVVAKVNSMNFTEDEFDLDLNPSSVGAIPMAVTVSMNMTIIHEDEASSEYRRFYHRRDYDLEDINYIPDSGKATSTFKDGALDSNQSKSPLSFKDSLSDYGKGNFNFPNAAISQQEGLKGMNGGQLSGLGNSLNGAADSFNSSLSGVKAAGGGMGNLNDVKKKGRLKNLLTNAKRLLEIAQRVDLEQVKAIKDFKPKVDDKSQLSSVASTASLANTPISSVFKSAEVGKPQDVPAKSKAMFPKFKSPSVEPPSQLGGNGGGSVA